MSASSPATVLFTLGNRQQLANALPVATELARRGVHCRLLALDPIYGQGVAAAWAKTGLPPGVDGEELDLPALDPPFARRSLAARWAAVRSAAEALDRIPPAAVVVVGVDGALERRLLARHRAAGAATVMLWDGLATRRPRLAVPGRGAAWALRRWSRFHLRRALLAIARRLRLDAYVPGQAAHTPVDQLCVLGPFVASALRDQGVPSPLRITGLPRFRDLVRDPPLGPPPTRRLLYLTSAFAWHDDPLLDVCQLRDLEDLARVLPAAGWTLRVRLHPREDRSAYSFLAGRTDVELGTTETSLREDAAGATCVATAASTAAVETVCAGRPLFVHLGHFPAALDHHSLAALPGVRPTRSADELAERLGDTAGWPSQGHLCGELVAVETGRSPEVLADLVTELARSGGTGGRLE